ncbi:protein ILRUN [Brevipalpus obovatus]|uniref:protein ILRUN n=1 Tax=Brevipalpus obovatus TaxID=246614 RepID=UPI003D9DDB6E
MAVKGANGDLHDLESSLLQQFSCLATQDKDVLIHEFQKLLSPNQLSAEGCAFFLDMNNWNLQQAICTYFDLDCPREWPGWVESMPTMTLIKDVTIGDGEEVPPNTKFFKTWKIQNSGNFRWPPDCSLKFVDGHMLTHSDQILVGSLEAGQIIDLSVEMVSPTQPGDYQGVWRMCSASGHFFGEPIWVIITVAEGGLLSLTQQMESFHQLGNRANPVFTNPSPNPNPFGTNSRQYSDIRMPMLNSDPQSKGDGNPSDDDMRLTASADIESQNTERIFGSNQQTALFPNNSTWLGLNSSLPQPSDSMGTSSSQNGVSPFVSTPEYEDNKPITRKDRNELARMNEPNRNSLPPTPPQSEDMIL